MEWLTSCDECKMNLEACGEHTEQKALSQIGLHEGSLQYISNISTKDNEFKYRERKRFVRFACRTFLATMYQFSYSYFGSAHMLQGPTYLILWWEIKLRLSLRTDHTYRGHGS